MPPKLITKSNTNSQCSNSFCCCILKTIHVLSTVNSSLPKASACLQIIIFDQGTVFCVYGFNFPGFSSRKGQDIFLYAKNVQTVSGVRPDSYSRGNRGVFLGVKWVGREANHSSPSSAQVKKTLRYPCAPLHAVIT